MWRRLSLNRLKANMVRSFLPLIRCDYGWKGVVPLIVGYLFRRYNATHKTLFLAIIISLSVFNIAEIIGLLGLPFILSYRGNQGRKLNKWFFYAYYPAHSAVLLLIRLLISACI